jgi:transposase InsO family protein
MLESERENGALERFTVIAPLLARGDPRTLAERIAELSEREWTLADGSTRRFAPSTIEGWHYAYKARGFAGLRDKPRSDKGASRSVTPELDAELRRLLDEHPRLRVQQMIRHLRGTGDMPDGKPSDSTLYRHVGTLRAGRPPDRTPKERRAFEAPHPGSLWQADIMYGPHVPERGGDGRWRKRQTYLAAIIDDHSRLCVHGRFYFSQGLDALCDALEGAVTRRGVPERLYVDNGMVFSGSQLRLICARVGISLIHTRVRDAAAKGKVERFFKTVRMSMLDAMLELSPPKRLDDLNSAFLKWVEEEYNRGPHAGIGGMSPMERWLAGSADVRLAPDDGSWEHAFLVAEERLVRKDGTIVFAGRHHETDFALRGRKVEVRRRLSDPERLHVYHDGRYIGAARPLDRGLNARLPRRKTTDGAEGGPA